MTPNSNSESQVTGEISFDDKTQIKSSKKVFDLESKEYVDVVKIAPKRSVENMEQFVTLLQNDAKAILAIINDGLVAYDQRDLAKRTDVPVYVEQEDGTLDPFTGETLSEAASEKLKSSVLNLAKNMFGFAKSQKPEAKKAAKEQALQMLLGAPGALDLLKAQ